MNASAASADPLLRHAYWPTGSPLSPSTYWGTGTLLLGACPPSVLAQGQAPPQLAEPVPAFAMNRHERMRASPAAFRTLSRDKGLTSEEEWHLMRVPRIVRPDTRWRHASR